MQGGAGVPEHRECFPHYKIVKKVFHYHIERSVVTTITEVFDCREVRECLKLDPEHRDCFPHYKIVKKVDKLVNDAQDSINRKDYEACIESANKVKVIIC